MVKIKLIALMLILALVVAGCGAGDDDANGSEFEEVTASTLGVNHGNDPEPAPGFDGETITLGVIAPLSGLAGFLGTAINNGAQTYWDAKNEQGGVAGKYQVELTIKDTNVGGTYDRAMSLQAYDDLAPEVVAFQQVLGTDVVLALREKQLRDKKIIAPATLSGEWVRDPLTISVANAYQTQAINGVAYFAANTEISNPKICSLALDDSFGDDGVAGVEYATEKLNLDYTTKEQFTSLSPVSSQIDNLIRAQCNAVVLVATAVDVSGVMSAFAQKNADMTIIGLAPLWIPEADIRMSGDSRTYAESKLWVVSAGARWGDENVPGMVKMLSAIEAHRSQQKSNPFFMYGYVQAWAMDQVLEQAAANGDLSSAGVARALANVGTFDFEGLLPSYEYGPNSKTRKMPEENTIFKYSRTDASKLEPVADNAINFSSEFVKDFKY